MTNSAKIEQVMLLILRHGIAPVVAQLVDQVPPPHNQPASVLVLDTGRFNIFKPGGVC